MKETRYKCDNCFKFISDGVGARKHIMLQFQPGGCGIVMPPSNLLVGEAEKWQVQRFERLPNVVQFCDATCLAAYFEKKIAEINMRQLKS